MSYRVVAPDSGRSRFVQLLLSYTMWGYLYPGTDLTGTVRGLATPHPHKLAQGGTGATKGIPVVEASGIPCSGCRGGDARLRMW